MKVPRIIGQNASFRSQAPRPDPGLHRRAAKAARHVPFGQGAAATWPEESYVQGRIDGHPGVALRDLEASRDALSRSMNATRWTDACPPVPAARLRMSAGAT